MNCRIRNTIFFCTLSCYSIFCSAQIPEFEHIVIDTIFRSESCTTADINQDGLKDIVIGDLWYKAPNWEAVEIREPGEFFAGTDEEKGTIELPSYSNSFAVQALDANGDELMDILIYPVMNQPITCYLNPGPAEGHWKSTKVVDRYHGESPLLVDLHNDGQRGALAGVHRPDSLFHLSYVTPNGDESWQIQEIGHTSKSRYRGPGWDKLTKWFAAGSRDHGLGVGDIDGDGYNDVLTRQGWYQAPKHEKGEAWAFHNIRFDSMAAPEYPQYQFAQMPIFDIDGDGDADFLGSSAHRYGLWWFEQVQIEGKIDFNIHEIPFDLSQAHAVAMGDLNNNGKPDIVLGKRNLAHNGRDPGWDDPLHLVWLEPNLSGEKVQWQIEIVHSGVGVGTQVEINDIDGDGLQDILVSNKKGTHYFRQVGQK